MNNDSPYYKDIEFTYTDDNIDYYVIISYPLNDHFIPEHTIIFQMEPWVYDCNKNWGVKCWKEWANPDPTKFLHVRQHVKYLNPAQWMFKDLPVLNTQRLDRIIAVISGKLVDDGHNNRVNFIKYVEEQGLNIIDIYGYQNYHNFRNYKGQLHDKSIQHKYKYVFSVENNREYNYATEKIWESFISCSLCFYDGCPNLSDYIKPEAFIAIDCTQLEDTLQIIQNAIANDLWTSRLKYIIQAKEKTIKEYNALEVIYKIISNIT